VSCDEVSMFVRRSGRLCRLLSLKGIQREIAGLDSRLFEFVVGGLKLAMAVVMGVAFVGIHSVLHCPNLLREGQKG